jgi:tetratricopeptide (TPR) repeat protein
MTTIVRTVAGGVNIQQRQDPLIGTVLGGYRVDGVAGRGGMGVVYRATDLTLDRPVAVKLVAPALAEDPEFRQRFQSESKLAASLDHPNVIPIYHAGEEEGVLFQVMRYVAGADLRTVIARDGPLEPRRVARITTQVAAALDTAHAHGLVHRDVKPANVLLAEGDHAYLTDFGLSKQIAAADSATGHSEVVGTVNYIAPEQIRNQPVDARTDVYALACVVFHMLTGAVPFPLESHEATMWAHLSTAPPAASERRPGLPPTLDAAVIRALSKAPEDRHQSAGEFASELRAAVERPSTAPPRSEPEARVPLQGPLLAPTAARLVDRVQESARIARCADEVEGTASRLVLITGEAGIGKTRLATELATSLFASGWTVLYGRAARESVVPYEPFVEAIRHFLTHHPLPATGFDAAIQPELSELARIMPELRVGAGPQPYPADDAHMRRYRMFEGVVALLAWMLAEAPVCLVIDDLHWADHATLQLLAHVLRSTQTAKLLVVATGREQAEPQPELAELLSDLRKQQRLERIALAGMSAPDTRALVGEVAGECPPEQFAEVLREQTGGNPFFIEEVVREISHQYGDEPRFDRAALERMGVPDGVKELIAGRLRHSEAAEVLAVAAVLGQSFEPAVLARLLDRDLDAVLVVLDAGIEAGFVVAVPSDHRFAFRHALVREALHETFSAGRRALLHLRAGEALESARASAAELALHFWEARAIGGAENAIRYSVRAAESARHAHADHEAVAHYRRALEAWELTHERDRELRKLMLDAHLGLGSVLTTIEGYTSPGVRSSFEGALALAEDLDDGIAILPALWGNWAYWLVLGEHKISMALAERCVRIAEEHPGEQQHQLVAMAVDGYQRMYLGEFERAREELEWCARHGDILPPDVFPHDPIVIALVSLSVVLWFLGEAERSREIAAETEARIGALDPKGPRTPLTRAFGGCILAWRAELDGRYEEAIAHAEQAYGVAHEAGIPTWEAVATLLRSIVLCKTGRLDDGLPVLSMMVNAWRSAGADADGRQLYPVLQTPYYAGRLAEALADSGDTDGALAELNRTLVDSSANGEHFWDAELLGLRSRLTGDAADLEKARRLATAQGATALLDKLVGA